MEFFFAFPKHLVQDSGNIMRLGDPNMPPKDT